MGGGHKFEYPKWVWSPAGGWWPKPAHEKRNAFVYITLSAIACFYVYQYSEANTVRFNK